MTRQVWRRLFVAAAAATLAGHSALAADLGGKVPVPDPVPLPIDQPDWAGTYFGGHAGADVDGDNDFVGGLQLGYNLQSGNLVYGAEGDISFSDDTFGSIRGRAGFAAGQALFYGTVGIAIDDDDEGLVAGGGVEYKVAGNASIGVEALHYDLDDDETVIRGRLNWHFGGGRY